MSQILTVQINEQTYGAIRAEAEASGIAPSQVATETLERYFRNGQTRTEREKQAARERFERHFGEVNFGLQMGADNDTIDADLAREYASNHEGE
jgi:hypothetical protein